MKNCYNAEDSQSNIYDLIRQIILCRTVGVPGSLHLANDLKLNMINRRTSHLCNASNDLNHVSDATKKRKTCFKKQLVYCHLGCFRPHQKIT